MQWRPVHKLRACSTAFNLSSASPYCSLDSLIDRPASSPDKHMLRLSRRPDSESADSSRLRRITSNRCAAALSAIVQFQRRPHATMTNGTGPFSKTYSCRLTVPLRSSASAVASTPKSVCPSRARQTMPDCTPGPLRRIGQHTPCFTVVFRRAQMQRPLNAGPTQLDDHSQIWLLPASGAWLALRAPIARPNRDVDWLAPVR